MNRGVVSDIAGAAHRAGDLMASHQSPELVAGLVAGVLAATIGVMQHRARSPSPGQR